jgi:predicted RNase H-like nuclease (RuvC/YqgF family)
MKKLVVYTLLGCLMIGNSYSSSWGRSLQQTSVDMLVTANITKWQCENVGCEVRDLRQEITEVKQDVFKLDRLEQKIAGVKQEITEMKQEMTKLSEMLAKFLEMQQNKENK